MKTIKSLINSLLIGVFTFALFYLVASFYSVTFDISKWTENTRALVSIIGAMFSAISMVITFTINENKS